MAPPRIAHCSVTGSGPLLLLLHPAGYDSRFWAPAAAALARTFEVVTFDRPGHGDNLDELAVRSARPATSEEYHQLVADIRDTEDEAGQVESLISRLGHRPVSVVGVSDAGLLALKLTARGHLDVTAVVLVESTVLLPDDISMETILARLESAGTDHLTLADIMATVLETKDPTPYVDWTLHHPAFQVLSPEQRDTVRDMLSDNAIGAWFTTGGHRPGDLGPEQLGRIRGRVLNLHGDPFPDSDAPLERLLTGANLVTETIPTSPPLFPFTVPHQFVERVTRFLGGGY